MSSINKLKIDPKPTFDISPWLYMQFMEPLGTNDSSVEACWDHAYTKWGDGFVNLTKELSPTMIRWGGIISSYYRWREAVGPRDKRVPMLNYLWGGMETNQIGTEEFCDFCDMIGAEKLIGVNFLSDGKKVYATNPLGQDRCAGAEEAAEWVDYCNNPDNKERISHGRKDPYNVKMWQIGNETSYGYLDDGFNCEETAKHTLEFAKTMKKVDPSIVLIGWGDTGWAPKVLDVAGEHLEYIAFHDMYSNKMTPDVLRENDYRKDWDDTWEQLMNMHVYHEKKINEMRQLISGYNTKLALTECHFGNLKGRNRCEVFSSWAAGVAIARSLNVQERNGDILKIATHADFAGTRWMCNAVMVSPKGKAAHMMPVAYVMSLFRKHIGKNALAITNTNNELDITASITEDKIFLHVVNTNKNKSIKSSIEIDGYDIVSGTVFELCAAPEWEVMFTNADQLQVQEKPMDNLSEWSFPAASVSAVELTLKKKV